MKSSGIGGQAVIEGIMMRNKEKYAIAVRKPDQNIEIDVRDSKLLTEKYKWLDYPIIRGVFNFVDSLVTGISTISYSASFYDDPAEQKKTKADEIGKAVFKDKLESVLMAVTVIVSVLFAVGLFMLLPYFISRLLSKYIVSKFLLNFIEGVVRVLIFILYIFAISRMNDIKRTFMYHGAEHKCINCIEHGARLTPQNVKNSSRFHKRCGTSFLFLVMFISVIFFIFIRVDNTALQLVLRILLIPVIAGVSYEIIRWAGRSDNAFVNVLSKPGLMMQKLTTKEPDMDMIEVAIAAVESVFDWKTFLGEYYEDSEHPEADMETAEAELALSSSLIIDQRRKTRSLHPEEVKVELSQEAVAEGDGGELFVEYEQEEFVSPHEEDDASGSTVYDHIDANSDEERPDVSADDNFSDEEDWMDEEGLPEGFELIEEDSVESAAGLDEGLADLKAAEGESETGENEETSDLLTDGFEFVEEIEGDDTCADDVPIFKQRKTDKQ